MNITFTESGWEDYLSWKDQKQVMERIHELIKNTKSTPFKGIGKPEPLKNALQGCWSRRINKEHRLVYRIEGKAGVQTMIIFQCRYHY